MTGFGGWAALTPAARRIVPALWLMYALLYVDRVNIATAGVAMRTDLGLSVADLGLVFSAFAYPYAALQVVGGWFGDRLGPRRALALGIAFCALATMATGLAGGLLSLFVARVLLGVSESAALPVATRAISLWLPENRWASFQGLFHSAARLGNAVTPPLIALIIHAMSWRASFVIVGLVSLAWVGFWWWRTADLPAADATRPRPPRLDRADGLRLVRQLLPLTACDFCYGFGAWLFMNWLPSFFHDLLNHQLHHASLFAAGVLAAGVAGNLCGGLLSDRLARRGLGLGWGRRIVVAGGFAGALVCLAPLLLSRDIAIVTATLAVSYFCLELIAPVMWSMPMDIAPDHAGTAAGIMNTGFAVAGIISPLVVGGIVGATDNWLWAFAVTMGVLAAGILLAMRMRPEVRFQPGGSGAVSTS